MNSQYPQYHSLVDKLAAKVITRVVTDGLPMEDAIKEAIHFAELSRQQTIHLCFTLADYGLVYNGEPKDYFYTPADMGKAFPSTNNGYVVYANKKPNELEPIFESIQQLKTAGFNNNDILDINSELDGILSIMDNYSQEFSQRLNGDKGLEMAASISSRTAQAIDVEKPTPENLKNVGENPTAPETPAPNIPDQAPVEFNEEDTEPAADETEFVDEGSDATSTGATVTISPSPSELNERISKAPKWSVDNILSIDKAKSYYENLKKELENVVLNDMISIGDDLMSEYDDARHSIDEQINKIDEAQKQTTKLEEKQEDLQSEFQEQPAGNEAPTDSLIAAEEGVEQPEIEEK